MFCLVHAVTGQLGKTRLMPYIQCMHDAGTVGTVVLVLGKPGEVGFDVPEKIEGQLACFLFPSHVLAVLGLPQLIRKRHCQVVLTDMLLHLQWYQVMKGCSMSTDVMKRCLISTDTRPTKGCLMRGNTHNTYTKDRSTLSILEQLWFF